MYFIYFILLLIYTLVTHFQLEQQKNAVSQFASDASHLLLTSSALGTGVVYVAAAYLFCPYTIASCVAQTTSVFANLIIAAAFASMVKGIWISLLLR